MGLQVTCSSKSCQGASGRCIPNDTCLRSIPNDACLRSIPNDTCLISYTNHMCVAIYYPSATRHA